MQSTFTKAQALAYIARFYKNVSAAQSNIEKHFADPTRNRPLFDAVRVVTGRQRRISITRAREIIKHWETYYPSLKWQQPDFTHAMLMITGKWQAPEVSPQHRTRRFPSPRNNAKRPISHGGNIHTGYGLTLGRQARESE